MALTKYCCCYTLEVGVTLIGFLQLNAALYFWARASTFEPIYLWMDIIIASLYTMRATYFFLMLNDDASAASRIEYFDWHKFTAYGLGGCGLSLILLKWIEWSHPPTWTIVAWMLVAMFNYYHWIVLADYAGVDRSETGSSKVELTEQEAEDDAGEALYAVNKIE